MEFFDRVRMEAISCEPFFGMLCQIRSISGFPVRVKCSNTTPDGEGKLAAGATRHLLAMLKMCDNLEQLNVVLRKDCGGSHYQYLPSFYNAKWARRTRMQNLRMSFTFLHSPECAWKLPECKDVVYRFMWCLAQLHFVFSHCEWSRTDSAPRFFDYRW